MANGVALVVAALLLLAGVGALVRALDQARLVRTLRTMQPRPVGAPGPAFRMVHGRLEGVPPLRSPYQGRPCLYYFFRVLEPRPSGQPRLLATGKEWSLASVRDDTGAAAIEPWTAIVASPRRFEARHDKLQRIPEHLVHFFERAGIDEKHLPRLPSFVVHEYTLEAGDDVYVVGTYERESSRFVRRKRRPLVVSAERDVGLVDALRNELVLYAALAPLLLLAALAIGALGLSA